jgi:hypothetical protein
VLDVSCGEDQRRIRQGAAADAMAMLWRIALTVLRTHPRTRYSICARRRPASWDHAYLLDLLMGL